MANPEDPQVLPTLDRAKYAKARDAQDGSPATQKISIRERIREIDMQSRRTVQQESPAPRVIHPYGRLRGDGPTLSPAAIRVGPIRPMTPEQARRWLDGLEHRPHGTGTHNKAAGSPAPQPRPKAEGVRTGYNPATGQVEMRTYHKGKLDGAQQSWDTTGQRRSEGHYRNGQRDGTQRTWDASGNLRTEENYANGRREGQQQAWDAIGRQQRNDTYKDGKFVTVGGGADIADYLSAQASARFEELSNTPADLGRGMGR